MTNYKPQGTSAVEAIFVGGHYYPKLTGQTILGLVASTPLTTTADAFRNGNADYQVPSGKVFRVIGLKTTHASGTGTANVYQGDTANAITTFKTAVYMSGAEGTIEEYPLTISFAATKYVTLDPSIGNCCGSLILIGYEENE